MENTMEGTMEMENTRETKRKYCIIRSYDAGCFAGYLEEQKDLERMVVVRDCRRLWYWDGGATLSQIAKEGVKAPENCKFPCEVDRITIYNVCEIIETTEEARQSIQKVKIWER